MEASISKNAKPENPGGKKKKKRPRVAESRAPATQEIKTPLSREEYTALILAGTELGFVFVWYIWAHLMVHWVYHRWYTV